MGFSLIGFQVQGPGSLEHSIFKLGYTQRPQLSRCSSSWEETARSAAGLLLPAAFFSFCGQAQAFVAGTTKGAPGVLPRSVLPHLYQSKLPEQRQKGKRCQARTDGVEQRRLSYLWPMPNAGGSHVSFGRMPSEAVSRPQGTTTLPQYSHQPSAAAC